MTDEDFARLTRALATVPDLPDGAHHIALAIDTYRDPILAPARKKPDAVRDALQRIVTQANEILGAFRDTDVKVAMTEMDEAREDGVHIGEDRAVTIKGVAPLERLADHCTSLACLRDWATSAAEKMPPAKPGTDAGKIRKLIGSLDVVLMAYTRQGLTRAKHMVALAHDVCRIADPDITEGMVTGAIDALRAARRISAGSAG
jgi:hypothetical protein